jgi:hypothetical protein
MAAFSYIKRTAFEASLPLPLQHFKLLLRIAVLINCFNLKQRLSLNINLELPAGSDEMYIMSVRNRPMPVVFVGLDKIQQKQGRLEHLQQVALIDAGIDSAGQPGTISAIAKSILCDCMCFASKVG